MTVYQTELARLRKIEEDKARIEKERLEAEAREKARLAEVELRKAQKLAEDARIAAEAAAQSALAETKSDEGMDPFDAILAESETNAAAEEESIRAAQAALDAQAAADAAMEAAKQSIRDIHNIDVQAAYVPKVTGSASKTYEVWDYEITDPTAVPLFYRPINEALIAAEVRKSKGSTSIPGVKVSSHQEVK
jgi:hypothetical protein